VEVSVENYGSALFNRALLNSLRKIQATKTRFHLLDACRSTQAVLTSQIELCDVLLEEIRTISCSLEKRKIGSGAISRRGAATRRNRNSRYVAVPQPDRVNRSKRTK
jgi:hypothetical protein